ncbi:MAG TPA: universal stress protein [Steroidobacteraceae bacterium]|nr:universal stress protein [Steroidobacteraceae bacterium]
MRKILVAIDGSDTSLRALDFAVQQARLAPAAELQVLTVQPLASTTTAWEIYVSAEKLREIAAERARAILEEAGGRLTAAGCRYALEQLEGEPAETIAGRAAQLGCESITMGTRGAGQVSILVMGSVAQRVVYHATVPVTLVK